MKAAGIFEAKQSLSEYVEQAQDELIVLTKHGKPAAILIGIEGLAQDTLIEELDSLLRAADPKFWAMIQARRASTEQGTSIDEVRKRIGLPRKVPSSRSPRKKTQAKRAKPRR